MLNIDLLTPMNVLGDELLIKNLNADLCIRPSTIRKSRRTNVEC
ncbi:hypothetical protein AGR9A_Lc40375 [Agrobacterium salinitolerans str. Hayward 0363]|nr:hypothetical protein AGR9A_Lc40375 [Agrobacterium salinitolerans str. Hayward 0363]